MFNKISSEYFAESDAIYQIPPSSPKGHG